MEKLRQTLVELLSCFERPVCVEAPDIAADARAEGVWVTELGREPAERARVWDLAQPVYVADAFDFVLCDASAVDVEPTRLFRALRVLSHFNLETPIVVSVSLSAASRMVEALSPFGVRLVAARVRRTDGPDCALVASNILPFVTAEAY